LRFRYSTEENGRHVKKAVVYTQNEHHINFSDVDSQAVYITERLQANGYETYIVGGAVRDLILGKKPKDFDIVTEANPAKIKKIFRNSRIIGRRFRLVHVFFGPKIFEVSTFRSIKDGPTSNTFGTIEEDVLRRDFSINALFYDPLKQIVVDYVGGMDDIHKGLIRPIIALQDIFVDDPVRMIRAVKYAAVTGFKLPLSLRLRIHSHSPLLADISPSRLTEEIFKIINSPHALEIVMKLDALGLYFYLQPQATELFKTRRGFKTRYLKTLAALNKEDSAKLHGETLSALIRDYLEETADWDGKRGDLIPEAETSEAVTSETETSVAETATGEKTPAERHKNAFMLARKFILPMNPPRAELDAAVRLLFAEHGVIIKRMRFSERGQRSRPVPAGTAGMESKTAKDKKLPAAETEQAPVEPKDNKIKRMRQHSRRRKAKPGQPDSGK